MSKLGFGEELRYKIETGSLSSERDLAQAASF